MCVYSKIYLSIFYLSWRRYRSLFMTHTPPAVLFACYTGVHYAVSVFRRWLR